jgi:hypothetical protein
VTKILERDHLDMELKASNAKHNAEEVTKRIEMENHKETKNKGNVSPDSDLNKIKIASKSWN